MPIHGGRGGGKLLFIFEHQANEDTYTLVVPDEGLHTAGAVLYCTDFDQTEPIKIKFETI
jgi:hypothetical protein